MARARAMPYVGCSVVVRYLGTGTTGIVQRVEEGGRRLTVLTDDEETLTFALSPATGRFVTTGEPAARLLFAEEHGD
jgi:hypothetical protein